LTKNAGAVAAAKFLTAMNLFAGQSPDFFSTLNRLAKEADKARRRLERVEDEREEAI
jgi:hypothetical protein